VDQFHTAAALPEVDIWHYPKGFLPLLSQPRGPVIGTVNDVILQFYADHYPAARSQLAYRYWLGMLRRSIPRFSHILTISQFSKKRIEEFCERHKLRCPPISVTYLARQWNRGPGPFPSKDDFVLHLASKEPHKRTATLLRFWHALASKRTDLPALHLVGQLNAESQELLRSVANVQIFTRQTEEELKGEFLRARALIFPSEIEGFGLPALEAYEMRTPVVFAAGTPVREIFGPDSPGEFDLNSLESFEDALDAVISLDSRRIEAKAAALHEQFSWGRCADETLAVYQGIC
jgi:glycosyltransferase involved in cell wall biosynthesis